jgi:hypothetical protein
MSVADEISCDTGQITESWFLQVAFSQQQKMGRPTGLEPGHRFEAKSLENADLVECQSLPEAIGSREPQGKEGKNQFSGNLSATLWCRWLQWVL